MKKLLYILTIIAIMALLCAGCASNEEEDADWQEEETGETYTDGEERKSSDNAGDVYTGEEDWTDPEEDWYYSEEDRTDPEEDYIPDYEDETGYGTQYAPMEVEGYPYGYFDTEHKYIYDFTGTGNFEDIDHSVFSGYILGAEEIVGRWYEDGFSNGYSLELYGDGSWQFNGEVTVNGWYITANSSLDLMEGHYGIKVASFLGGIFDDTLSMSVKDTMFFKGRNPEVPTYWKREENCTVCEDLDAYYSDAFPYRFISGTWEPEENDFFREGYGIEISSDGNWSEYLDGFSFEAGLLTNLGGGRYSASEADAGGTREFEYIDGHLYYEGVMFSMASEDPDDGSVPDRVVGTWCTRDMELGGKYVHRGYIFNDDWTYIEYDGDEVLDEGSFVVVGEHIFLYDENGSQIHSFWQNTYLGLGLDQMFDDDSYDRWEGLQLESTIDWEYNDM